MVDVGQGRLGILTISEHLDKTSVTWTSGTECGEPRDLVRGAIVGGGVGSWAPAFCRTWGRESRRLNQHSPVSVAGLVAGGDEKTNVPLTTGPPTAGPRDWHGPSQPPRLASPNGREGRRGDHVRAESTTRCEARHGQERVKHRN